MTETHSLDAKTFKKFTELIYERSGISLGDKKEALVQARVGKRMRALGLASFRAYYDLVAADESGNEVTALLDAIATNVTHFFREQRHFELLGRYLKQWEGAGQRRFRIWSAAASTGEEPYSIAMTVAEALRNTQDAKILATDLSTRVIQRAREAVYEERQLETVPRPFRVKYFLRERHDDGVVYRVNDMLRAMITFGRINLAHPPFPLKGPLDVVFCRNVMIYFDNEVRARLLAAIYDLLKPRGYLMVGHAESLSGMLSDFKSVEPSVYVKD